MKRENSPNLIPIPPEEGEQLKGTELLGTALKEGVVEFLTWGPNDEECRHIVVHYNEGDTEFGELRAYKYGTNGKDELAELEPLETVCFSRNHTHDGKSRISFDYDDQIPPFLKSRVLKYLQHNSEFSDVYLEKDRHRLIFELTRIYGEVLPELSEEFDHSLRTLSENITIRKVGEVYVVVLTSTAPEDSYHVEGIMPEVLKLCNRTTLIQLLETTKEEFGINCLKKQISEGMASVESVLSDGTQVTTSVQYNNKHGVIWTGQIYIRYTKGKRTIVKGPYPFTRNFLSTKDNSISVSPKAAILIKRAGATQKSPSKYSVLSDSEIMASIKNRLIAQISRYPCYVLNGHAEVINSIDSLSLTELIQLEQSLYDSLEMSPNKRFYQQGNQEYVIV